MFPITHPAASHNYSIDIEEKINHLKIKNTALEALFLVEKAFSIICYASPLSCVFVKKIPLISNLAQKMWILGIAILVLEKIGSHISKNFLPPLNRKIALNNRLLSQLILARNEIDSPFVAEKVLYDTIYADNQTRAKASFEKVKKKIQLLTPLETNFNSYFDQFDAHRSTEKEIYKQIIEHFLPELLLACGLHHPLFPEKGYHMIHESVCKTLDSDQFIDGFYLLDIPFKRHQQLDHNHPILVVKHKGQLQTYTYKQFSLLCTDSSDWDTLFQKFPFAKIKG